MQMQQLVRRFGRETTALLSIAWPLIINNLSVAGMQFTDAVMAGQLGAESLAAVAVGGRFRVRRIRRLLSPRQKRTHREFARAGCSSTDLGGRFDQGRQNRQ